MPEAAPVCRKRRRRERPPVPVRGLKPRRRPEPFDERDPAVKALLQRAIQACLKQGKYVGICGQGPSDHPDFADWLAQEGIVSISLNPDTVVDTWLRLARIKAG